MEEKINKKIDGLIIKLCDHINNGITCIFNETKNDDIVQLVNALANLISVRDKNKGVENFMALLDNNINT